ncbi:transcriptional regulator [Leucobacter sp. Psy1]|uniref:LysR family transcriptional regulator n=1 Tax=Leucobacter sp. Psy1 TaxID=2875729 RepID=UPI001CD6BB89|nr:LysR family transcriptional regulator [Leucobacter sp. Psy1]UBH05698.1 transcriptional regulator [Leucobacter sp. Psy1]
MDLNLLRTFAAIYESRSLTAAAENLYVSPSAVSQTLAKLRQNFDDRLFIRVGREMSSTAFADELYGTVREALDALDRAVATRGFAPRESRRRFKIALTEMGELHWAAPISRALRRHGPHISLDVQSLNLSTIEEDLTRGTVDLAIHSANLSARLDSRPIKSEDYAVLLAAKHPLAADDRISFEDYCAADHVFVSGDSGAPWVRSALARLDQHVEPRLHVNHFSALPRILQGAALIATVPGSLAEVWSQSPEFAARPLPFGLESIQVRLYSRRAYQDAPALHWFRETVTRAITETESRSVTFPVPFVIDEVSKSR